MSLLNRHNQQPNYSRSYNNRLQLSLELLSIHRSRLNLFQDLSEDYQVLRLLWQEASLLFLEMQHNELRL